MREDVKKREFSGTFDRERLVRKGEELKNRVYNLYYHMYSEDIFPFTGGGRWVTLDYLLEKMAGYVIRLNEHRLGSLKQQLELDEDGLWVLRPEIKHKRRGEGAGREYVAALQLFKKDEEGVNTLKGRILIYYDSEQGPTLYGYILLTLAILLNSKRIERGVVERLIDALPFHDEVKNAIYWIAENAKRELETQGLPVDPFTDLFGVPYHEAGNCFGFPHLHFTDERLMNVLNYVVRDEDGILYLVGMKYREDELTEPWWKQLGESDDVTYCILSLRPVYEDELWREVNILLGESNLMSKGKLGETYFFCFKRGKPLKVYVIEHRRVPRETVYEAVEIYTTDELYAFIKRYGRTVPLEEAVRLLEDVLWRVETLYNVVAVYSQLTLDALEYLRKGTGMVSTIQH